MAGRSTCIEVGRKERPVAVNTLMYADLTLKPQKRSIEVLLMARNMSRIGELWS